MRYSTIQFYYDTYQNNAVINDGLAFNLKYIYTSINSIPDCITNLKEIEDGVYTNFKKSISADYYIFLPETHPLFNIRSLVSLAWDRRNVKGIGLLMNSIPSQLDALFHSTLLKPI